ncbi:tetratricopeptide repeat protein [Nocardiopsis ansamitocini]|uniref:TPR repeat protein n=1 Tax=Nocardiopsis ansamitocini TaxID=1670832 RepID=A0A9W6UI56_9ACTN|nr:tetratricopeptide repeat protein [Nocardiopsis ansamitocini]GLU47372.1 hypothetical protein Nans01_17230 [Nocardiopsis ansamitocini]
MGAHPDIFEDLRRVGALKRDRLNKQPSDNALSRHTDVNASRDTVGAWLRGTRFPQQVEPLLGVLAQICAEAARRGLLDTPADSSQECTVAQLLDPQRWRESWHSEQHRRTQANQDAAQRHNAHHALKEDERRARQQALADRPRPLHSWSPQRLGVHAAIPGTTPRDDGFVLPRYIPRPHDTHLRAHIKAATTQGARPQMVVVRGASCTGKTRTAFEAVRATLPNDFALLFPTNAEGLLAVLAADALGPRTVLWLNEAQQYLNDAKGEAVAAALLRRLDTMGPLLVVATLWPAYDQTLTRRPAPGQGDPHPKARELLAQAHYTYVPDSFTDHLDAAREAARHDPSLTTALQTGAAGLTQILAAGPDLVQHYEHPAGEHGPYGQALISAAMDAHRLKVVGPLPLDFLQAAAPGYLTDTQRASADPDWFTHALTHARTRVKDTTPPLQDIPRASGMGALPGVVRLADFLQQHGRRARATQSPPASFWNAATTHLSDPTDLTNLAYAALQRARLRHAAHLYCAAADAGDTDSLVFLAHMREAAGDREGAERLYREAVNAGHTLALVGLARLREETGDHEEVERLARQALEARDPQVLMLWALARQVKRDREGAERFYRGAADAGLVDALAHLAHMREAAGDREGAERFYREAADAGLVAALVSLAQMRLETGDREGAERFYREAVDAGHFDALVSLAQMWLETGDREGAERFYREAVDAGHFAALVSLAQMRLETGDREGAERFYREAADAGVPYGLVILARMCLEAGDREGAERLAREAVDAGHFDALVSLAQMWLEAGDREGAERLCREAVDAGNVGSLAHLAQMRLEAGDREGAERFYREAADAGNVGSLAHLAQMRLEAGDREGAEQVYRQAVNVGLFDSLVNLAQTRKKSPEMYERYGLDADGNLAEPWEWPEPRAL